MPPTADLVDATQEMSYEDFDLDFRITVTSDTRTPMLGATSWVSCQASCSCPSVDSCPYTDTCDC